MRNNLIFKRKPQLKPNLVFNQCARKSIRIENADAKAAAEVLERWRHQKG